MTEQELVDIFYPNENITINDLVTRLTQAQVESGWTDCTEDDVITELKSQITEVTNWSI
tara:strand:- start:100 stop:276 length:177 start_codon:yes stop_codon:yes gene_type:complete